MAVTNAMFLFEVVVENVKSLVESRFLVIRSEFADIFSLELKDPKQMHIVIPEPPPLPPEPPGKKGKKKKPPPKKGKKGKVEEPPPEPVIQSGQSVLFTSSAEFLIQNMKKFPMEMSLWSKEDNLTYIGSSSIPWDQRFVEYLEKICNCQEPLPITLNEEYNIFEEGTAKLMAKIGIQVKLTYLTDKVTTSFRTLSEDPAVKKVLYTGVNSKTTSFMITLKTTDQVFEENCNKIENNFTKDKPKPNKIVYADYKNAPGANLTFFNEGDYCCMGNADKPPESIYKAPETCPDIDHIVDYVRKIIVSCNDNMRMLTPRPTITPRIKATDIDRLCYCRETKWPMGEFAKRFKKEAQSTPCPECINAGKRPEGNRPATFDIANIRGPCGRPDCRIARDMRAYIENLVEEDNEEFKISDVIGPCGSKTCTLAENIMKFLRHEGEFKDIKTLEGLSTQCACMKTMQDALTKRHSCASICDKDCQDADSDDETGQCHGKTCPFNKDKHVYNVYYFTVEHDFAKASSTSSPPLGKSSTPKSCPAETQSSPGLECINTEETFEGNYPATFDIANIRGPCGKPDCKIARDMREYIENLAEEDNEEFKLSDIIGPCGSKSCPIAENITKFIRHEGEFENIKTLARLSTQCSCLKTMEDALTMKQSGASICSEDCKDAESEDDTGNRKGKTCPINKDKHVYHVYYFTVEHDFDKDTDPSSPPSAKSSPTNLAAPSGQSSRFKFCGADCPTMQASEKSTCSKTTCPSPFLDNILKKSKSKDDKCTAPVCTAKLSFPPSPADSKVEIRFDDIHNPCCVKSCDLAEQVKDFIVDAIASRKKRPKDDDPCYCDCVCTFKFSRKTTYCAVCGGYECLGDDMKDEPEYAKPHPCPVYHKLYDKKYIKVQSPWPEEDEDSKKPTDNASTKSSRTASRLGGPAGAGERKMTGSRSIRSFVDKKETKEKGEKKVKAKPETKKIGKFTATAVDEPPPPVEKKPETKYPYPPVPKNMGWNWNAEDIPGMKPRPKWKPGAANKILVRRYRAIREGIDTIAKKKRAMMQRKKKIEMKPTLVVKKYGGEYTVQMEVFKKYSKERLLFQYPYDEKPPLIYTIGKSAEEKLKIQKQKERRERRETRRKSRLLQSTFRDKCQEICLKAYNQAIGLLPLPNPNSPDCPCHTDAAKAVTPPIDSCSCSDEGSVSSEDTDDDEWTIEFTPPAARWDQKAKHPPVMVDNESQYNYLDYKVKLLDKSGNQVPRFFKGPDGKQECSDLGGFWGPDHVWMEITKDGYIGPDNRWVPMNFIGPDGMFYSAEEGFFTDAGGQVLKIGIDGYIDKDGKWVYYSKRKGVKSTKSTMSGSTKTEKSPRKESPGRDKGDAKGKAAAAPPPAKGKAGDKKSQGTKSPNKTATFAKGAKSTVMNVNMSYEFKGGRSPVQRPERRFIDPKKVAKYREIMKDLEMYDDFYELRPPIKTNRASNTPSKKVSPFTMDGFRNNMNMVAAPSFIKSISSAES